MTVRVSAFWFPCDRTSRCRPTKLMLISAASTLDSACSPNAVLADGIALCSDMSNWALYVVSQAWNLGRWASRLLDTVLAVGRLDRFHSARQAFPSQQPIPTCGWRFLRPLKRTGRVPPFRRPLAKDAFTGKVIHQLRRLHEGLRQQRRPCVPLAGVDCWTRSTKVEWVEV